MLEIKRILFADDFSECAEKALPIALALAQAWEATLHLLHVVVPYEEARGLSALTEEEEMRLKERMLERLEAAKQLTRRDAIAAVKTVVAVERDIAPAPGILDYAEEQEIDLIVMGTHGRRGFRHFLMGSVAEEVVRLARCPVITTRQQVDPWNVHPPRRILVPVDFSEHSRTALRYGRELAAQFGGRLTVLYVIEELLHPAFYNTGVFSIYDVMPDVEERSKKALEEFVVRTDGPEVPIQYRVAHGKAVREILHEAEREPADLIVMSTHGLTGLQHLLLGSVTERVVRQAPCPVWVAKAFGKSLLKSVEAKATAKASS
jgi:nucleotide-binding universal stress UspA family protein